MKRAICLTVFTIIVFFITGCSDNQYDDWQTIYIEDTGTIEIPADWKSYTENDYLYIVDANDKPMMIQTKSVYRSDRDEAGIVEANKFAESVQCTSYESIAVLSNSAVYGKRELIINGERCKRFYLDITEDVYTVMLFWDTSIDETMVKKIAESYIAYPYCFE